MIGRQNLSIPDSLRESITQILEVVKSRNQGDRPKLVNIWFTLNLVFSNVYQNNRSLYTPSYEDIPK